LTIETLIALHHGSERLPSPRDLTAALASPPSWPLTKSPPEHLDALTRRAAETRGLIPLGGGLPSEAQFPRAALAESFLRVLNQRGSPALQYGWPEGLQSLRQRIAERLRDRGLSRLTADDIIVTNGAQQGITLATELLGRPGGSAAVDAESYPSALDLFRSRKLRCISLSSASTADFSYTMPAVANPRGGLMTPEARAALLSSKRPIIEDDAYGELTFSGPPPSPLAQSDPSNVLFVGTFSKTLCPGLRVGWLIVPERWQRRALRLKQTADLQSNSLAQAVVDDYLSRHDFGHRLVTLRRFYRRRAARLAEAISRTLPSWTFEFPAGGFGLWLKTDGAVDEAQFLATAIDEGVGFDPGSGFHSWTQEGPTSLRLCFSLASPRQFEEGVARLARAWRRCAGGQNSRDATMPPIPHRPPGGGLTADHRVRSR
jgi:2-aminoadipate transaminase